MPLQAEYKCLGCSVRPLTSAVLGIWHATKRMQAAQLSVDMQLMLCNLAQNDLTGTVPSWSSMTKVCTLCTSGHKQYSMLRHDLRYVSCFR